MSKQNIYATNVDRQGRVRRGSYIKSGECIFPFSFKKKVHNKCLEGTDGRGLWCPTSLKTLGQKYDKGVPKSKFGSVGHCPDTESYPESLKIKTKKYKRAPRRKQSKKSKKSKKTNKIIATALPANANYLKLKTIIGIVQKRDYYNASSGWNNKLLQWHLKTAQNVDKLIEEDVVQVCNKKNRYALLLRTWKNGIKTKKTKDLTPLYHYMTSPDYSSPKKRSQKKKKVVILPKTPKTVKTKKKKIRILSKTPEIIIADNTADISQLSLNLSVPSALSFSPSPNMSFSPSPLKLTLTPDVRLALIQSMEAEKSNIGCDFHNKLFWLKNDKIPGITKKGVKFLGSGSSGIAFAGCPDSQCNKQIALKLMLKDSEYRLNNTHPTNVEITFLNKIRQLFERNITPHVTIMFDDFKCDLTASFLKPLRRQYLNEEWFKTINSKKLLGHIHDESSVVVTELANGGDLESYVENNQMSPLEWKVILFQVFHMLTVMQYHHPGFRHNDFKPNNILVNTYTKTPNAYFVYKMFGEDYYVPDIGITLKMWDFDFSLDNNTLNVRDTDDFYKEIGYGSELNPTYDIHAFFNYLLGINRRNLPQHIIDLIETILPPSIRGEHATYTNHFRLTRFKETRCLNDVNIIPSTLRSPAEFLLHDRIMDVFHVKPDASQTELTVYDTLIPTVPSIKNPEVYNSLFRQHLVITRV